QLVAVGLKAGDVTYEQSTTVSSDLVIRTDPPASQRVPRGTAVKLILARQQSTDPTPHCQVPDVAGRSKDYATSELEEWEVKVGGVRYEQSDLDAGTVIRTDPGAGEYAGACRSVTLVLPGASVPDVTGMTESDARSALQSAGFTVRVSNRATSAVTPGT